jgi:hypothetical protein
MYQLNAHVKPKKNSEYYGKALGAHATIFIDFKEIDGAYVLAKYYIEDENWEIIELEREYFIINSIEEMDDDYREHHDEVLKYGYSLIFNTYNSTEDEEA